MGRNLDDVIAALPAARQKKIEARFQELKQQVEGLGELRRVAGKAQAEIASALNIKQPSVSKIEKQADLYLSTLRNYVEAIGGKLDLIVNLPSMGPIRLEHIGDLAAPRRPSIRTLRASAGKRRSRKSAAARAQA